MIRSLIGRYVDKGWKGRLDFSTLELVPAHYVTQEHEQRESDLVWRVRLKGSEEHFYVYILLELQSTIQRFMALRLLLYLLLFYESLFRGGELTRNRKLPPVLPIVLYNGFRPWNAPGEFAELVEEIPGLERFVPHFQYLVIDVARLPGDLLEPLDDPTTAVFRFEQSQSLEDLGEVVEALAEMPLGEQDEEIKRDFAAWLRRVILPTTVPGEHLPEMQEFQEIRDMLAERVKEWPKQWLAEGRAEGLREGLDKGRREGRREGRQQGLRDALSLLLEKKFGPLSAADEKRLKAASQKTLAQMTTKVLTAASVDEVFSA